MSSPNFPVCELNLMEGRARATTRRTKERESYQPILTFIAETREYMGGELRNGDRRKGAQIARHLEAVFASVPRCVRRIFARANAGFYCWEAVAAYEKAKTRHSSGWNDKIDQNTLRPSHVLQRIRGLPRSCTR